MSSYLLRRLLFSALSVAIVATLVFVVFRLMTNPATSLLPPEATQAEFREAQRRLGLDRPIYVQYLDYVGRLLRGDLGRSYVHEGSVREALLERIPATLTLVSVSLAISAVLGIGLGILAALRHNSWLDHTASILVTLGQSMPVFWTGIVLILVFAVNLKALPSFGYGTVRHLVLPVTALAIYSCAQFARLARSSILETVSEDYVRTAKSKGVGGFRLVIRHVLKNASIPLVTMFGLRVVDLLTGSVVVEAVFAWPGIATLMINAMHARDLPMVEGSVIVIATLVVIVNLLVDVTYGIVDPRIRYA